MDNSRQNEEKTNNAGQNRVKMPNSTAFNRWLMAILAELDRNCLLFETKVCLNISPFNTKQLVAKCHKYDMHQMIPGVWENKRNEKERYKKKEQSS